MSVVGLTHCLWSRLSALNIISESQIVSRIFFFSCLKVVDSYRSFWLSPAYRMPCGL